MGLLCASVTLRPKRCFRGALIVRRAEAAGAPEAAPARRERAKRVGRREAVPDGFSAARLTRVETALRRVVEAAPSPFTFGRHEAGVQMKSRRHRLRVLFAEASIRQLDLLKNREDRRELLHFGKLEKLRHHAPARIGVPLRQRLERRVKGRMAADIHLSNHPALLDTRPAGAYLSNAPRGVGKTTMARLLARALNCAKGPTETPCGTCELCRAVHEGADADVIEMDAASNRSVEDARDLREGIRYAPLRARSKIYIIDEAHMLTREAFNTLLNTLEEPPPHVKFIFATTEVHKLPDTIISRCQRYDFRRITTADIVKRLRQVVDGEKIAVDDAVLAAVARSSH